jgi:hypothetical protein
MAGTAGTSIAGGVSPRELKDDAALWSLVSLAGIKALQGLHQDEAGLSGSSW